MTAPRPNPWCCRAVELAAWVLPAGERQRYALEFIAELYGIPQSQQIHHSAQVLLHAWALRAALVEVGVTHIQEVTMTTVISRPLRCRLSLHRWRWATTDDGDRYQCCVLCGRDRTEQVGVWRPKIP